jgi:hypothetical protein
MVVVMQTALGSFDFAGFFASEETCCAQDDRDRRTTEKRRWQGRKPASLRMTEIEIEKVARTESCFAQDDRDGDRDRDRERRWQKGKAASLRVIQRHMRSQVQVMVVR